MTDNVSCATLNGNKAAEENNFTELEHNETFTTLDDNAEMENMMGWHTIYAMALLPMA